MKKKYIWGLIGIFVLAGSYYWYSRSDESSAETQYVTDVVEKGTLTSSISATGSIIVDQQANIDPTITGTVADLAVKAGDNVSKGQFLFNIINDQLGVSAAKSAVSLQQAQSSLQSAKATKRQAEYDYDQGKEQSIALNRKLALKNKLEAAEISLEAAKDDVATAQADLASQRKDASERRVVASIAGTVNAINIKNGDDLGRVSSNDNSSAPIIIGDLKTLKAEVEVNEVDIATISSGQKVVLKLDALSSVDFSGQVEKIDSLGTVDQGVVSYKVTVGFDQLDERIKPDMSVSASIITEVKQAVTIVPSGAIKNDGKSNYVEIIEGNSETPTRKEVTVGSTNNTETEVVSGLSIGDKVVTQTINPGSSTTSSKNSSSSNNSSLRIPGLGGGQGR